MSQRLWIAVVAGMAAGAAATYLTIRALHRMAVLDVPNARSSHSQATPRGGGVGVAVGVAVAMGVAAPDLDLLTAAALATAGVGFGAIGFGDDLAKGLPVKLRFSLQVACAALVAALLLWHLHQPVGLLVLLGTAAALWTVSYVNAFNFMDGINGISSAQGLVAGVTFAVIGHHAHDLPLEAGALALVAGVLGFAPFNFPRARVFLGDVGSYLAGAWLAALVVIGLRAHLPPEAMIGPLVIYGADTAFTLVRRIHRGAAWREAHHEHTYQRLVELGWSHAQTTGLVFGLMAGCAALGGVSLAGSVAERAAADCAAVLLTVGYLALPGLLGHGTPPRWQAGGET